MRVACTPVWLPASKQQESAGFPSILVCGIDLKLYDLASHRTPSGASAVNDVLSAQTKITRHVARLTYSHCPVRLRDYARAASVPSFQKHPRS